MAGSAENEILFSQPAAAPSQRKGRRFASSTVRHRHRISVKSKGADLVARKLATKFGEKAEAAVPPFAVPVATMVVVVVVTVVVEVVVLAKHKGNRFPVNRDPRFS